MARIVGLNLAEGLQDDVPVPPQGEVNLAESTLILGEQSDSMNHAETAIGRLDGVNAVSVVVPVYNRGEWIGEAIESAMTQSLSPHEVIVVDDGSTDDTRDVCQRMGDRIRYVRQSNRGVCAARNRGARMAEGRWIAFLDSDDRWHSDKLEKQIGTLLGLEEARWSISDGWLESATRERETAFQAGFPLVAEPDYRGTRWFQEYLEKVDPANCWGKGTSSDVFRGDLFSILLRGNLVQTSSLVVDRRLFETVGGFDESLFVTEDYDLALRLAALQEECAVIADPLYRWTFGDHESLASSRNTQSLIENALYCLRRARDQRGHLTEEEEEAYQFGRRALWRRLAYYCLSEFQLEEARGAVSAALKEGLSPSGAMMAIYCASFLPEWGLRGLHRMKRKLG